VLAKAWLCKSTNLPGACGECHACLAFERGRAADYLDVWPAGASRIIRLDAMIEVPPPDDGSYPIKVQQFIRTPPLSATATIVVIHEADRLNQRAANSLLKTLEEPPPYARFILTTESVGSILPTVLSRCLAIACELPAHPEGFEPWALDLACGAPGRAREFQQFAAAYRPIFDFGQNLRSRDLGEALVAAEEFAALADSLQAARKLGARAADAEALQVLAIAYGLSEHRRGDVLQAITEAHRRVVGNANASSVFDALFATALG